MFKSGNKGISCLTLNCWYVIMLSTWPALKLSDVQITAFSSSSPVEIIKIYCSTCFSFAETLPDVPPLRKIDPKEDSLLSEFQRELVELASFLSGDYFLSSFIQESSKQMTVRQANAYVKRAVSRFLEAGKQAKKLGADDSAIVNMRSSLTTKTRSPWLQNRELNISVLESCASKPYIQITFINLGLSSNSA